MNKLTPARIHDHWDDISLRVAECLAGDDDRPEDVYAACSYGDAHLYMADDGFAVLRKRQTRRGIELRVWCAHCRGEQGALDRYDGEIKRLAREIGARAAVFETHRLGFDRALPDGWKRVTTTYEMEIAHG